MALQGEKTKEIYQRALKAMPLGVNSNFRFWGPEDTLVITRGEGAYIWDPDGNRYIDYRLGFGPVILGHVYPAVIERIQEALQSGSVFALTHPLEIQVAERIIRMTGVDMVRLTNTGTEATMHALRIARAFTGREKYIKFEGQYHGMADYFMFSTASSNLGMLGARRSPIPAPVTSGIPQGIGQYVIVLPYNDRERLEETIEARWGEIAAVFVEPVMGNSAGIRPLPGFLEKIRELCDKYGILMVFDEVKTGFRIARGGAQEYFGLKADLVTYAKAMANGFPIAAIAGKEKVMMTIGPGSVAHAGTYTGNLVGVAAADATLEILENQPVLDTVEQRGRALMAGIDEILTEAGIPHILTGLPAMFGFLLGSDEAPHEYRDYLRGDANMHGKLIKAMIRRGVMPDSDGREPWFLCYSLDEADVGETLNIFRDAVEEIL